MRGKYQDLAHQELYDVAEPAGGTPSAHRQEELYLAAVEAAGAGPGRMAAPPPLRRQPDGTWRRRHSGEWDWFEGLARAEQARLRQRWFAKSPLAESPDEIAERIDLLQWLDLTRRADLARSLSAGRRPRASARFGGLGPSALSAALYQPAWPSVAYQTDFAMVSMKQALARHRWYLAGKVSGQRVVQSGSPRSKRAEGYYDEDLDVIRTAVRDKVEEAESAPYVPGHVRDALAELIGEPYEAERPDYITPDGPAGAIFFGQLGTGQWA